MSSNDERDGESHSLRGEIDRAALTEIRDVIAHQEPLATTALDDPIDPKELVVEFDDGLGPADGCRLDVQWTTRDDYKFHYTDSESVDFRWGNHPHGDDYVHVPGTEHFHPPPDASSNPDEVEKSCIEVSFVELVTRAVLTLWRAAYHAESMEPLNAGSNPP